MVFSTEQVIKFCFAVADLLVTTLRQVCSEQGVPIRDK
jgi:hypothetical protein